MIKKNLLSMAALALLASAAQAQVTVYGNVDLSVGRTEFTTGDKSVTAVESGVNTGSYFGLKGEEDLGGGLRAFEGAQAWHLIAHAGGAQAGQQGLGHGGGDAAVVPVQRRLGVAGAHGHVQQCVADAGGRGAVQPGAL